MTAPEGKRRGLAAAFALLSVLIAAAASAATLDQPVQTTTGAIMGSAVAPDVHGFFGVSFAAPPIGNLRWRAPEPVRPWAGIREAKTFAPACAQAANPNPPPGPDPANSEDCLYLNFWTPAHSAADKLPVMVWIYGGGFQHGSAGDARFDGKALARKGVILVTVGYRLGPFGFLAHPELTKEAAYHASGNYGMLDQIAALAWVRDNIARFGGDPAKVTVFGESAGSTSVNILQASPLAKGLFRRAIGESTSQMDGDAGLRGRQSLAQAEQAGLAFQGEMGAHSLAEMRALPAERLAASQTGFWPIERDGYLLPDGVYETFAAGRQNAANLLVGANSDEGGVIRRAWIKPQTAAERADFQRFYGGEADARRVSDTDTVLWQMWSWAKFNARAAASKTYLYWFTQPVPPGGPGRPEGPVHGAEIVYVFDNLDTVNRPWSVSDRAAADDMSSYWTNFAKTGDPNGGKLPHWPTLRSGNSKAMELSGTPGAMALPRAPELKFLDAYFAKRRNEADRPAH